MILNLINPSSQEIVVDCMMDKQHLRTLLFDPHFRQLLNWFLLWTDGKDNSIRVMSTKMMADFEDDEV